MNREDELNVREQLSALGKVQDDLAPIAARGARQLGMLCVSLGLALGILHGLLHVFNPERSLNAFFILTGVSIAAIIGLCAGYLKLHKVLPRGLSSKYLLGLFGSIAIYAATLALIATPMSSILVALLGLAVAIPLLICGVWMIKR